MLNFFQGFWKVLSFTRSLVLNLIFIVIVIAILVSIVSGPRIKIPDSTALHIAPSGVLVDQKSYTPSPFDLLRGQPVGQEETLVRELVSLIDSAANDKRITGLVVQLDFLRGGGISKLNEIGQALEKFKATGKPVIAYADSFTQQQYYLASFANAVYINELGNLFLTGYGIYQNYIKDAADKLKIDFHVFRVGEYKDAVEPYMRNDMSDASREHNSRWINELWGNYTSQVEQLRQLEAGAVNEFIAQMPRKLPLYKGSSADYAEAMGFVDGVFTRIELRQKLIEMFGPDKNKNNFASISMDEYQALTIPGIKLQQQNIGLIVASGTIYDGNQPDGAIGSDSLSELIALARKDDSLRALIIRIDSGGGSAFASEVIRQEILATRSGGLPVYVSMGSVAASGGYWIATAADEVWATPSTITGSIGVWGLYPNIHQSLNSLGIHSDGIGTSKLADAFRPDRPLSIDASKVIQSGVDNIYKKFITLVADARSTSTEKIHEIAQGRVWTGNMAKQLNLIDKLGSLDDVITAVATEQGVAKENIKVIAKPLSFKEQFLRTLMQETQYLGDTIKYAILPEFLAENTAVNKTGRDFYETLSSLSGDNPVVFAKCLTCNEL